MAVTLSCLTARAAQAPDSLRRTAGVSVRTNLLWWAASEPNVGVEYALNDHWSVGVDGGLKAWPRWMPWDWDTANAQHWRNFAVVPEVRYYLSEIYRGWFTGVDFVYTHYNVGKVTFPLGLYPEVQDNRLQGSFWGGGVLAGYAWWPWQHWRLELEAGVAAGLAAYDRFACEHCGTKLAEERKVALVPKLALNVAYNPVSREEAAQRRKLHATTVVVREGAPTLQPSAPVAFVVKLKEVAAPETAGDTLSRDGACVVPIEKYRPLDHLPRQGRDSVLFIQYALDSYRLEPGLGRNASVLEYLENAINTIRRDARTDELLVSVVGLASIEGPVARNDSLSVRRARAVAEYLNEKTGLERSRFETIGKGEAWDWFKAQLLSGPEDLTEEEAARILEMMEQVKDPDRRELWLKAQPSLYGKVKRNLLAHQRNAGYIRIYYGVQPHEPTRKLNTEVFRLIERKQYKEAVKAIQADEAILARVYADPEAMNAYAIALYFTAMDNKDEEQEQEALKLLRQAAREGSECAAQNLKGTDIYGPARKEFEAWQEAMKAQ